ncbi:MAG: (p)ppGpp synthetase [Caulobacteraceae bacterium]|nr:(p)ppGpp synthetase [Caulobacteraceae bacterium]
MTKTGAERFKDRYRQIFLDLDSRINEVFGQKKNEFKDYYSANQNTLRAAEDSFRNLTHLLLSDAPISTPKIISRLKDRDECIKKFELKYRNELEKSGADYKIEEHITDIIGIRVICLYETDINVAADVIKQHFEIISITDKTQILTSNYNNFGYKGLHIDGRLNARRAKLPEYKRFSDLRFEIQIRSIVQDAWSEVDHRLKYKRKIPDSLQRRIVRLAALFELADQEFISIREETENFEKIAVQDDKGVVAITEAQPINAFSFLSIMTGHFPRYTFSPDTIDGFVDEIVHMKPNLTDVEMQNIMREILPLIQIYREDKSLIGIYLNPFTVTRHVLYHYDPKAFSDVLFPNQKAAFTAWFRSERDASGTSSTQQES